MILPLKDNSKIYVAIPYSKVNKKLSFRLVNWICAELSKDGLYFSIQQLYLKSISDLRGSLKRFD